MRAAFVLGVVLFAVGSAFADGDGVSRKVTRSVQQGTMVCSPTSVRSNQSFTVHLPENYGPDVAIVDPVGRYFFLSFRPSASAPKHIPPITEQALRSQKTLVINANSAKGIELAVGSSGAWKKIFGKSGVYRVLISQTLETEAPVLDGWCEVLFEK
ncbi:hypothetical protein FHT32_000711 [Variovorax sp. SG517]|uniref:hypothetical protein n=1 Tax=Variovorax sp. SG517 TaxID=2587117 RepID=UPI00159D9012|nr:hypothetical protein [Variovorax sp. SG517]NVM87088.1 hypothetical protein [Variovorax sp. SG517]